jgi:hypothetical protein
VDSGQVRPRQPLPRRSRSRPRTTPAKKVRKTRGRLSPTFPRSPPTWFCVDPRVSCRVVDDGRARESIPRGQRAPNCAWFRTGEAGDTGCRPRTRVFLDRRQSRGRLRSGASRHTSDRSRPACRAGCAPTPSAPAAPPLQLGPLARRETYQQGPKSRQGGALHGGVPRASRPNQVRIFEARTPQSTRFLIAPVAIVNILNIGLGTRVPGSLVAQRASVMLSLLKSQKRLQKRGVELVEDRWRRRRPCELEDRLVSLSDAARSTLWGTIRRGTWAPRTRAVSGREGAITASFGVEMASCALADATSTCRNGGMSFEGSVNRIMAPFVAPTKVQVCREKGPRDQGSAPFGGRDGRIRLFSLSGASTATKGAWPPPLARAPDATAGGCRGSMMAPMAPLSAPSKVHDLQEKPTTAKGSDAFGCAHAPMCLFNELCPRKEPPFLTGVLATPLTWGARRSAWSAGETTTPISLRCWSFRTWPNRPLATRPDVS